MNYYFTSITSNYLAKARVLCNTLKLHNKASKFVLAISDKLPIDFNIADEPFDEIVQTRDMNRISNKEIFFFKHTITELCTAVKPFVALEIMDKYDAESVIYLDPDIAVFDNLRILESYFGENSILLTPHQYKPETEDLYIRENEILFLKRGAYNLGFFGVKNDNEGRQFLDWWSKRLNYYCFDDNVELLPELSHEGLLGMFTDQKWIDLVPCFFEKYLIIKEPGYNVCTWNLTNRRIRLTDSGKYFVDNKPLYFFHFSGVDSGGHINEVRKNLSFFPENKDVLTLSKWYESEIEASGQSKYEKIEYDRLTYSNGEYIKNFERKILHIRKDIYSIFTDPYQVNEGNCFYKWIRKEYAYLFKEQESKDRRGTIIKIKSQVIDSILPIKSKRRYLVKKLLKKF